MEVCEVVEVVQLFKLVEEVEWNMGSGRFRKVLVGWVSNLE